MYDCDVYTNSITEEFLDDFIIYLEEQNLRFNTIVGYILKMQSMVRKASQYNYAIDPSYNEIEMQFEETNAVFLSMNEIARIYYYKFVGQDKRRAKERIRDLFIIGCLTALRYSDYSTLTAANLQGDFIVKRTKKTNVDVKIPAHDYVKEIFAKYNGRIPMTTLEIMRLTGHKTEQNFFRYIRLTNDDTARSISGDMFFRK